MSVFIQNIITLTRVCIKLCAEMSCRLHYLIIFTSYFNICSLNIKYFGLPMKTELNERYPALEPRYTELEK